MMRPVYPSQDLILTSKSVFDTQLRQVSHCCIVLLMASVDVSQVYPPPFWINDFSSSVEFGRVGCRPGPALGLIKIDQNVINAAKVAFAVRAEPFQNLRVEAHPARKRPPGSGGGSTFSQGLKPDFNLRHCGTTEVVPCYRECPAGIRGDLYRSHRMGL